MDLTWTGATPSHLQAQEEGCRTATGTSEAVGTHGGGHKPVPFPYYWPLLVAAIPVGVPGVLSSQEVQWGNKKWLGLGNRIQGGRQAGGGGTPF